MASSAGPVTRAGSDFKVISKIEIKIDSLREQYERCKEDKIHNSRGPGNTETEAIDPDSSGVPEAAGGAQDLRDEVPRTTPQNPPRAVSLRPCATVIRGSNIVLIPTVLCPLVNIAMHIKKTKCVGLFFAYWMSLP